MAYDRSDCREMLLCSFTQKDFFDEPLQLYIPDFVSLHPGNFTCPLIN